MPKVHEERMRTLIDFLHDSTAAKAKYEVLLDANKVLMGFQ